MLTDPHGPGSWRARYRWPARAAYLLVLLIATLIPFATDTDSGRIAERITRALHPSFAGRDVVDAARNVVLFAGWGLVWALGAADGVRRIVVRATLTGAAISALVETLQLFSSNRNTSFLDLTTNTAGAFAGAAALILLVNLSSQRRSARSFVGIPALLFAVAYGAAALLEAVIPLFRQQDDPIAYGGPLTRFAATLAAFRLESVTSLTVSDFVIFLPAGALAVAALAEHGAEYPAARAQVLVWGTLLALAGELLHGFLGQPILLGAFLSHVVALALGGWIAAGGLPRLTTVLRGPMRPRALTGAYTAILAAWQWRPFLPRTSWSAVAAQFGGRWYQPLNALGSRMDFFSVSDVCAQFLLYLPLGGLLSVWPIRRTGWLSGPLPAVYLAFFCEATQLVVLERTLDVTVPLIQAAGAVIGWAIVRRAGYRVYGETHPRTRG